MTTTVTVKTGGVPAVVTLDDNYHHADSLRAKWSRGSERVFQGKNESMDYTVTDTRSITVRELPMAATGLDDYHPTL